MENNNALLTEAVQYLKANRGFDRLLAGLIEKYRSLGRLGGTVTLANPTSEERLALETLLRRRLTGAELRITAQQFIDSLAATKFGCLDPVTILSGWYGRELISKQQERQRQTEERTRLLQALAEKFTHPYCQEWLAGIQAQARGTARVRQASDNNPDFVQQMCIVLRALSSLPAEYQHLPVFARKVCGDPHGLDIDSAAGKLFLDALRYIRMQCKPCADADEPETLGSTVEATAELLYHFKLVRDDIFNFVTCFGLTAYTGEGQEIDYWRWAAAAGAPLNVPLREIVKTAGLGQVCEDAHFAVYIVENSAIFSALLDDGLSNYEAKRLPPLVCLHGQFKLASWALLDRLIASGAVLYYSGDFDPEGLQMADKLLGRYPENVRLWRMTLADYFAAGPSVPLDIARLSKLGAIKSPALQPLAEKIASHAKAAYQEGLLAALASDWRCGNG